MKYFVPEPNLKPPVEAGAAGVVVPPLPNLKPPPAPMVMTGLAASAIFFTSSSQPGLAVSQAGHLILALSFLHKKLFFSNIEKRMTAYKSSEAENKMFSGHMYRQQSRVVDPDPHVFKSKDPDPDPGV